MKKLIIVSLALLSVSAFASPQLPKSGARQHQLAGSKPMRILHSRKATRRALNFAPPSRGVRGLPTAELLNSRSAPPAPLEKTGVVQFGFSNTCMTSAGQVISRADQAASEGCMRNITETTSKPVYFP